MDGSPPFYTAPNQWWDVSAPSAALRAVALRHTSLRLGVEPGGYFTAPQTAKEP